MTSSFERVSASRETVRLVRMSRRVQGGVTDGTSSLRESILTDLFGSRASRPQSESESESESSRRSDADFAAIPADDDVHPEAQSTQRIFGGT